jgi:flagellar biosynthesis chaperone FliJ
MATKTIKRIAKLRADIERQAQIELGRTQRALHAAERSLDSLHAAPSSYGVGSTVPLAMIELARRAALSTAFAIEGYKQEEEERLREYQERMRERKQIDALARRAEERELKERQRREQKALDDWAASNFKRDKV